MMTPPLMGFEVNMREALIKAVQAVTWNASNYPAKIQPYILGQDIVPLTMKIVDAVEAVFEQTHTPSDGEREAARAYADAEYPELRLAPENEDKADIAERAFLAGAGFRRTAVQEPQGEPTDAQVRAAEITYWGGKENARFYGSMDDMRAALRAAYKIGSSNASE